MVCCSTLITSGRNGAPHVSPFAERTSASFNSQSVAVGICGTAGAVRIFGAVGILNRVWREGRAVATAGGAGRIRILRVRAQLAAIVLLLVIQPRRICPAVVPMYEYKTRPHCRIRAQCAAIVFLLVVRPRRIWPAVAPMYECKTRPPASSLLAVMVKGLEVIQATEPASYQCFQEITSASGRGRQDLIYDSLAVINREKSRRVIFKIRLRSAEQRHLVERSTNPL